MHFPSLTRRANYSTKACGNYYADYKHYSDEINEDCKSRCVYCDVHLDEIGGEGMHLDHFRPQKHFPELVSDPNNLVLACPKCNQLKSDWWPEKTGTDDNGRNGFVDPFDKHKSNYFSVNRSGEIVSVLPPSGYFIDLMSLNRICRVNIRYRRIVKHRVMQLMENIISEMGSLSQQDPKIISIRLPILTTALKDLKQLLD